MIGSCEFEQIWKDSLIKLDLKGCDDDILM
jgi:hypothetical protein